MRKSRSEEQKREQRKRMGIGGYLAVLAVALSPAASAEQPAGLVVSAGQTGGYYHKVAQRLRTRMSLDHRRNLEIRESPGSLENLQRLVSPDDPVNVALAQADALARFHDDHAEAAERLLVLADIGEECVFLVTNRESGVASLDGLRRDAGQTLSISHSQSGAAITWEYLKRLQPELSNTQGVPLDTMEALLEIQRGGTHSKLRAAMWVQHPGIESRPLGAVLANLDSFRVIPIRAEDLREKSLPDGRPIYTFREVVVRHEGVTKKFDTLCTQGLLLAARDKIEDSLKSELIETVLKSKDYITP